MQKNILTILLHATGRNGPVGLSMQLKVLKSNIHALSFLFLFPEIKSLQMVVRLEENLELNLVSRFLSESWLCWNGHHREYENIRAKMLHLISDDLEACLVLNSSF